MGWAAAGTACSGKLLPSPRRPPGSGQQGQRQPVLEICCCCERWLNHRSDGAMPSTGGGGVGRAAAGLFVPAGRAWVERWRAPCRTRPTGHRQEEEEEQAGASSERNLFGCLSSLLGPHSLSPAILAYCILFGRNTSAFLNVHEPRQNHAKHDEKHDRQNGRPSIGDAADTEVQGRANERSRTTEEADETENSALRDSGTI